MVWRMMQQSNILFTMTSFAYDGLATSGEAGTRGSSNNIF
jgi:hypothetical protein